MLYSLGSSSLSFAAKGSDQAGRNERQEPV
jgi:hypothetical protein